MTMTFQNLNMPPPLVQLAQCMPIIICHSSSDHFPRSDMVHRTENLRKNKRQPRVIY